MEEENEDAMFVFLSDVWLDQAEVLENLRIMFSGNPVAPHIWARFLQGKAEVFQAVQFMQ